MPTFELNKSIEVRKLNKRSKLPLSEPPVMIPYGGLVEDIEQDGDLARFVYLGELYQCKQNLLSTALGNLDPQTEDPGTRTNAKSQEVRIRWEELGAETHRTWRAKLPGGWLIVVGSSDSKGAAFYPDPGHTWDGRTLD